jgi:uncharacterized membrane protein (UPF0127 family)
MRVPIDVVFLDRDRVVVKVFRAVPPWRFLGGGVRADSVLEGSVGFTQVLGIAEGVRLEWE